MAKVSTYLNFARETEAAFNFYKSAFGTEFVGKINRMGEVPPPAGRRIVRLSPPPLVRK